MADEKKYAFTEKGFMAFLSTLKAISKTADTLKEWMESFPDSDNKTYGLLNRKPELIAEVGNSVIDYNVAMTTALNSLKSMVMPIDLDPETEAKVKALIGDEIWDMLEDVPVASSLQGLTEEEVMLAEIAELKSTFRQRYELRQEELRAMAEQEAMMQTAQRDVEPKKEEKK